MLRTFKPGDISQSPDIQQAAKQCTMAPVKCYYKGCVNINKTKSTSTLPVKDEAWCKDEAQCKVWIKHSGSEEIHIKKEAEDCSPAEDDRVESSDLFVDCHVKEEPQDFEISATEGKSDEKDLQVVEVKNETNDATLPHIPQNTENKEEPDDKVAVDEEDLSKQDLRVLRPNKVYKKRRRVGATPASTVRSITEHSPLAPETDILIKEEIDIGPTVLLNSTVAYQCPPGVHEQLAENVPVAQCNHGNGLESNINWLASNLEHFEHQDDADKTKNLEHSEYQDDADETKNLEHSEYRNGADKTKNFQYNYAKNEAQLSERTSTKIKGVICGHCQKQFLTKAAFIVHKRFSFKECSKNEYQRAESKMLITRDHFHKNTVKYLCVNCNKIFSRKINFDIHNNQHHIINPKIYNCNKCDKRYKRPDSLFKHVRRVHIESKRIKINYSAYSRIKAESELRMLKSVM